MPNPLAEATTYLETLEADRLAAIAISEQKAEEAKLIKARQEGFEAALEILSCRMPLSSSESQSATSFRRRQRRDIAQLILRELSFSGEATTIPQIAKAIDYIPERTETALKRLEKGGKVLRNEHGRWVAAITAVDDNRLRSRSSKLSNIGPSLLNSTEDLTRNSAIGC